MWATDTEHIARCPACLFVFCDLAVSYLSNSIILVYPVCPQLMLYPCSERPGSGVHENSWRKTDLTQRNPTNPSLLCPDQVKCLFISTLAFISAKLYRLNKKKQQQQDKKKTK